MPVIIVKNTNAAAVSSVKVENVTTGETIEVTQALAQNHLLKIDTRRQHLELSTDAGTTWSSAMADISETNYSFPTLTSGVRNEITVTGVATGTFQCTHRDVFI